MRRCCRSRNWSQEGWSLVLDNQLSDFQGGFGTEDSRVFLKLTFFFGQAIDLKCTFSAQCYYRGVAVWPLWPLSPVLPCRGRQKAKGRAAKEAGKVWTLRRREMWKGGRWYHHRSSIHGWSCMFFVCFCFSQQLDYLLSLLYPNTIPCLSIDGYGSRMEYLFGPQKRSISPN